MSVGSSIFRPYRGLGLVSSDVPFAVKYKLHSNEYNICVPVGARFNVYQLPNLRFVGLSDCLPADITSFTSDRSFIYASSENIIYAFRGLRHILFKLEGHQSPIVKILAFNSQYLASYDESDVLIIWNLKTRENIVEHTFDGNTFSISAICHPTGYGDKLLLGSSHGPLQLWKSLAKKPIYWFKGFDSPVTCLVQAPSPDVCAIGLGNGQVVLHNLRYDTPLISVAQEGDTMGLGASEALGAAGINNTADPDESIFLLVGAQSGQLAIWELESAGTCRAVNQVHEFHLDRVTSMFCIPSGESAGALVSNGADNTIKVSFFDRPDGAPRTGHIKSGHFLPPNKIAFWTGGSAGGSLLVSGGPDSQLRIFSTFNERYDRSLGRAYSPNMPCSKKKMNALQKSPFLLPGPSSISLSPGRAHDWDSIAVAHCNRREVSTWNFVKATRGRHWLDPKRFHGKGGEALRIHRHTIATCVFVTRCGHWVVIGYSSGYVVKFNIQSAIEYGAFGGDGTAHDSSIVGVHVTSVNRLAITVGATEVKFWTFYDCKLIDDSLTLDAPPRFSKFHDESDALFLALTTGEVILINAQSRRIIRRFLNPGAHPCTDLAISSDGTLMVTTHRGDPLIKTWDVVDCKLLDCFRVNQPATSVAFSPADDLLATTHVASLGVYLWDNRATYRRLHLKPLPEDYAPPIDSGSSVELPTLGLSAKADMDDEERMDVDSLEEDKEDEQPSVYLSPDQLQDKLATLSGLPNTFFTAFLQLDAIKKRNAEAMRVVDDTGPQQLPFFLPAIETTSGMAWLDEELEEKDSKGSRPTEGESGESKEVDDNAPAAKRQKRGKKKVTVEELVLDPASTILNSLIAADGSIDASNNEACDALMSRLRRLTPSGLDAEIRLLAPTRDELREAFNAMKIDSSGLALSVNPYSRLSSFLCLLLNRFRRNLDVDFATACLESLLRFHGDLIARPPKAPTASRVDHLSLDENEAVNLLDVVATVEASRVGTFNDALDSARPLELVEAVLEAKRESHSVLNMQVSRSIALVDFVRNAINTLQM
ncbi:unnamed protein product [Hymenolepis diminuta]|uniref:WD_REPEATS_REGION domain-containing protein n=1 Tax=Hymenolepis diminuta TaxID=6216 RepID=A0A0R3SIN6_HYMDI|nr:unnamed protein product [Hymenolepis diminuta]